jgi:hypothetical protein
MQSAYGTIMSADLTAFGPPRAVAHFTTPDDDAAAAVHRRRILELEAHAATLLSPAPTYATAPTYAAAPRPTAAAPATAGPRRHPPSESCWSRGCTHKIHPFFCFCYGCRSHDSNGRREDGRPLALDFSPTSRGT